MAASPVQLLERLVQRPVAIHLKDGRRLSGRLAGCDEHLNVLLEEAVEETVEVQRRLGRIVVRGSNIVRLTASGTPAQRGSG